MFEAQLALVAYKVFIYLVCAHETFLQALAESKEELACGESLKQV